MESSQATVSNASICLWLHWKRDKKLVAYVRSTKGDGGLGGGGGGGGGGGRGDRYCARS